VRVRVSWGWVKTYCYHIWRNNHPLTSYFRAPRVPRVLTHNQLRLKINILDLSGNCLTGAGETLAEALGVVASARLGVSSREWFDNFFAPQDPVSLSSQSGWAIDFFIGSAQNTTRRPMLAKNGPPFISFTDHSQASRIDSVPDDCQGLQSYVYLTLW